LNTQTAKTFHILDVCHNEIFTPYVDLAIIVVLGGVKVLTIDLDRTAK